MKTTLKIKPKRRITPLVTALFLLSLQQTSHADLTRLDDQHLADVTGQAPIYTSYIDPSASGNASGLGFYTLGINGTVSLNANIEHLQLGCGGVNGPGCDIDLSHVRLSGTSPGPSGTYADSDATLGNPFLQLAIKNPTSLANRQVVGIALGAQSAQALLSIGENPTPNVPGTVGGTPGGETGINALSGSFQALIQDLRNPLAITVLGIPVATGNAYVKVTATQPNLPSTLMTQESSGNVETGGYYQYVSGSRLTGVDLGPITLVVPKLNVLVPFLNINLSASATYTPINLIDLHNLNVSSNKNSGLLLSLNNQAILWPQVGTLGVSTFPTTNQSLDANGNVATRGYNSNGDAITTNQLMAQRGWWLSAPQANIGDPANGFITTSQANVDILTAVGGLVLGNIPVASVNTRQIPVQNCYGSLKFC
ncbi:hypothetical protein [Aquirhabdus parva]|uniref:Uncharacterized protein n=1 Tax=Aquirhabdus parva TaxID=2283318 RepID=A0A345P9S5_9GAMM|nr:hypothetical protein [Aquirhabdus parva]AXI04034.1 hypothetical protein HYN46_15015 [Aquirhabdus parva]